VVVALLLVLLPARVFYTDMLRPAFSGAWAPAGIPKASFARVSRDGGSPAAWARYKDLVSYIQAHTEVGEAIYSGAKDSSRLFVNDAMLYFIADRPSATRWVEMEPGLSNTLKGQQEIIDELQSKGVRLVVLWDIVSHNEPNATARSNGVHVLDAYIAENFPERKTFGDCTVAMRVRP
jgi:hypothetical protein